MAGKGDDDEYAKQMIELHSCGEKNSTGPHGDPDNPANSSDTRQLDSVADGNESIIGSRRTVSSEDASQTETTAIEEQDRAETATEAVSTETEPDTDGETPGPQVDPSIPDDRSDITTLDETESRGSGSATHTSTDQSTGRQLSSVPTGDPKSAEDLDSDSRDSLPNNADEVEDRAETVVSETVANTVIEGEGSADTQPPQKERSMSFTALADFFKRPGRNSESSSTGPRVRTSRSMSIPGNQLVPKIKRRLRRSSQSQVWLRKPKSDPDPYRYWKRDFHRWGSMGHYPRMAHHNHGFVVSDQSYTGHRMAVYRDCVRDPLLYTRQVETAIDARHTAMSLVIVHDTIVVLIKHRQSSQLRMYQLEHGTEVGQFDTGNRIEDITCYQNNIYGVGKDGKIYKYELDISDNAVNTTPGQIIDTALNWAYENVRITCQSDAGKLLVVSYHVDTTSTHEIGSKGKRVITRSYYYLCQLISADGQQVRTRTLACQEASYLSVCFTNEGLICLSNARVLYLMNDDLHPIGRAGRIGHIQDMIISNTKLYVLSTGNISRVSINDLLGLTANSTSDTADNLIAIQDLGGQERFSNVIKIGIDCGDVTLATNEITNELYMMNKQGRQSVFDAAQCMETRSLSVPPQSESQRSDTMRLRVTEDGVLVLLYGRHLIIYDPPESPVRTLLDVHAYDLACHDDRIFVLTSKGILVYDKRGDMKAIYRNPVTGPCRFTIARIPNRNEPAGPERNQAISSQNEIDLQYIRNYKGSPVQQINDPTPGPSTSSQERRNDIDLYLQRMSMSTDSRDTWKIIITDEDNQCAHVLNMYGAYLKQFGIGHLKTPGAVISDENGYVIIFDHITSVDSERKVLVQVFDEDLDYHCTREFSCLQPVLDAAFWDEAIVVCTKTGYFIARNPEEQ